MKLKPARRLRGHLKGLPGDKSISHRAALIAALARGSSRLLNYSTSADCAATLRCLQSLGVAFERNGDAVVIEGAGAVRGGALLRPPAGALDCGNSGSTMRMLAGVLAGQPFPSVLDGDGSLRARPMGRIIEPLELMGARISSDVGRAPLRVEGRTPLSSIDYKLPVASAQVKSCVLLAGLLAEGRTRVVEASGGTRDHTERMLRWFGVDVEEEKTCGDDVEARAVSVEGLSSFNARDVTVPGDISSAAFLVAAAAVLPGSDLTIERIGLNPTRTGLLDALRALGADVSVEDVREHSNEPSGTIRVRGVEGLAHGGASGEHAVFSGPSILRLIDELPVLAVIGTRVEGGLEIRGARELRLKESDRIVATVANLRAMGAEVEEFEDGLRVYGPARLRGARICSRGDHRIAMAFSAAALMAEGETEIEGAEESVSVSFPEFFPVLEGLSER